MTTDVNPAVPLRIEPRGDRRLSRFDQLLARAAFLNVLSVLIIIGAIIVATILLREIWPPRFELNLDQPVEPELSLAPKPGPTR